MTDRDNLAAIRLRLQVLEDTIAIYQLLSAYGPAVDSDSREWAAGLWATDGQYVTDGPILGDSRQTSSRDEVAQMLSGDLHQSYLAVGCAHVMSLPHVRVVRDRATAVGYQQVLLNDDGRYYVHRVTAHTFRLEREAGVWLIKRRTARRINGSEMTRDSLRGALRGGALATEPDEWLVPN